MEDLTESFGDNCLFSPSKVNMVVIDDWINSACDSDKIVKAFPKYVHHRNHSILYIVQNVFCHGKKCHTFALNTKYMVLFSNP